MTSARTMEQPPAVRGTSALMPLSVILPNYNHGKLVPRALQALLAQAPAAQEIIVVDDGSTDDSVEVIEQIQRGHPSIRLVRNSTNQGIVASVRKALDIATGEYVLFASADDFVLPGLFGHASASLQENPQAAFFCASVALLDGHGRVVGVRPFTAPRRGRGYLSPGNVRRAIRGTDFWVIGTATIYRRRLLAEAGYFDPRLGSIGDVLTNRLLAFRHGFCFDPAVLAAYNKDPNSFSGRLALSATESRRLLDGAGIWISEKLPADVRDEHRCVFERRMGFGMARLWIVWRGKSINTQAIADMLKLGPLDRKILAACARLPLSRLFTLGWLTLWLRPFSLRELIGAWIRAIRFRWLHRSAVQRAVDDVIG